MQTDLAPCLKQSAQGPCVAERSLHGLKPHSSLKFDVTLQTHPSPSRGLLAQQRRSPDFQNGSQAESKQRPLSRFRSLAETRAITTRTFWMCSTASWEVSDYMAWRPFRAFPAFLRRPSVVTITDELRHFPRNEHNMTQRQKHIQVEGMIFLEATHGARWYGLQYRSPFHEVSGFWQNLSAACTRSDNFCSPCELAWDGREYSITITVTYIYIYITWM